MSDNTTADLGEQPNLTRTLRKEEITPHLLRFRTEIDRFIWPLPSHSNGVSFIPVIAAVLELSNMIELLRDEYIRACFNNNNHEQVTRIGRTEQPRWPPTDDSHHTARSSFNSNTSHVSDTIPGLRERRQNRYNRMGNLSLNIVSPTRHARTENDDESILTSQMFEAELPRNARRQSTPVCSPSLLSQRDRTMN